MNLVNLVNRFFQFIQDQIDSFHADGVLLKSGREFQVDTVLFATGFRPNLDFLDDSSKEGLSTKNFVEIFRRITAAVNGELYLHLYPIEQKWPTLFYAGFIRLRAPYLLTVEMQSRWRHLSA